MSCQAQESVDDLPILTWTNKQIALVATVKKDLAAAQKEIEELKTSLGEGEHPEIVEKQDRVGRIKRVLKGALRQQDDILIAAAKGMVVLAQKASVKSEGAEEEAIDKEERAPHRTKRIAPGGEGLHSVWYSIFAGRTLQLSRQFSDQIRECKDALEDEIDSLEMEDEGIKKICSTILSFR
mmetsp:Transcript_33861/g.52732  ORF Transcript_33861/g.52732 Transcript_33861/m.52732 type:complete len:181 (-) Transcript_33861:1225-1767(-)